ncbi:Serine/threonine-protein kinase CTR1 [Acorus gramineus]|uniref:non-specific serine/threonine protein kinase n=1 Tax=Acorus gramineus TaxID=55184 RepID=A0AAV9A3D4_ACOGR|nr:Serine/threonine-protein kinase CTR1 [Acorus gramineus]
MDERSGDSGPSESGPPNPGWWSSNFLDRFQSISVSGEYALRDSGCSDEQDVLSPQSASQILWSTGIFSGPIPNGFYSVIPEKKLKELFKTIPSPDELYSSGAGGVKADIILVDAEKDKRLAMLKNLTVALVKGSNPASLIKKIAGLVIDFYKRPIPEFSPAKAAFEELNHAPDNQGIQLLGQIRHGLCRPRTMLFKVLADAVGLESKLVLGLPANGDAECSDSYKHMSVVVVMNSVELLVDLMRFPGQLIPYSTKAIFMSHISAAGESDSAENDSCDSPIEPNSPLCTISDRIDGEGLEHDENLQTLYQRRTESSSIAGPSLQKVMLRPTSYGEGKIRSDGTSVLDTRRIRRRSISITPEIGDDIVRAVRAMNETLKQNRPLRNQGDEGLGAYSTDDRNFTADPPENISNRLRKQGNTTQKATSLPSSPHNFIENASQSTGPSDFLQTNDMVSTWNKVLESSPFLNKPLLPFQDWNIDFTEITVGTRIGIGFFGEVFRGIWIGTDVAIKIFLEQDMTAENVEDFCNEISILSRLRHPNVILFLGACMKPPHLSMITEYVEMGSLYYLIHMGGQKKKLSWRRRLKMLCDICRGLMAIHRMKIVHRDLKSANCLVNKHWTVKICDFGLSRIMTDLPMRDNSSAGTPEWMAPELIRNEPFTEKCDIFSLGVIMWELCTLNRPWDGIPSVQVIYAVANEGTRLEIPEGPLGKLISDCWSEPEERPSCQEILTRLLDCEYTVC